MTRLASSTRRPLHPHVWLGLAAGLVLGATPLATRAAGDCSRCGQACCARKVCRVVCEMKEVKETKYSIECEDFCVPGPSCCRTKACTRCGGKSCDDCQIPTCGPVRTRKKLVKTEVTKKVPTYKCVVVDLCPQCAGAPCPSAE